MLDTTDKKLINLLDRQVDSVILIDAENKVSTQAIVSLMDYLKTQGK